MSQKEGTFMRHSAGTVAFAVLLGLPLALLGSAANAGFNTNCRWNSGNYQCRASVSDGCGAIPLCSSVSPYSALASASCPRKQCLFSSYAGPVSATCNIYASPNCTVSHAQHGTGWTGLGAVPGNGVVTASADSQATGSFS